MPKSASLRLDRLEKQYGKSIAVRGVSLSIEPGSMVALLGPSGCGKTSCLRMVAGLVEPTAGAILLNNVDITNIAVHRRNIGMLFQNYALFPQLTVAQNVNFGLTMRRVEKIAGATRVAKALDMVQLTSLADRYPSQLSGGQQQRVALARALVIEPDLLLLDEPLGALDKALRESMQVELRLLQRDLGLTTIMVTHDQDEAMTMADSVVVMRDGQIEQFGDPKTVYQKPVTEFVATFLGASNLYEVQREQAASEVFVGGQLRFAVPQTDREKAVICLRPEAISLSTLTASQQQISPNHATAVVERVLYRGPVLHYHLKTDAGLPMIVFNQPGTSSTKHTFEVGDKVMATWDVSSNHVLPPR